jgi:transcriptional regulator with XRE-family HTH domain
MEKKTIGKFIAVMRKANGMTQKELGDKLFVSDKTVSRWERDECTPELSLIPAIAEIFGITTDELLRGEKNNPETRTSEDIKPSAKADKQFKAMLFGKERRFDNLTLISIGISLLGLIVGMIINLGFSKGLIAFFVSSAFLLASTLCQICFTSNARITINDDDDYRDLTEAANTSFLQKSIAVYFVNIAILAFCLPLVTIINGVNFGLEFGSWILYGISFSIAGTVLAYMIFRIIINPALIRRNILVLNDAGLARENYSRKLLIRLSSLSLVIAILLGVAIAVVDSIGTAGFADKLVFETPEEFKEYMESSYDEAKNESGDWYYDADGNLVGSALIIDEDDPEPFKNSVVLRDKQGNEILEYYYHNDLYSHIEYNTESDDSCPITVYTRQAMREARVLMSEIKSMLGIAIIAEIALFAGIYIIKVTKKKN